MPRLRQGYAGADIGLVQQQAKGLPLPPHVGDIIGRAIRAIDQAEQRFVRVVAETLADRFRANRPAVLRLMAGEAAASVGSKHLKKGVARGFCWPVGLERRDKSARIAIDFEPRDYRRGVLGAVVLIPKQLAHFLGMGRLPGQYRGARGGYVGASAIRGRPSDPPTQAPQAWRSVRRAIGFGSRVSIPMAA